MNETERRPKSWLMSWCGLVLVVALGIAAVFLVTEHTAHVLNVLPFLVLLACPIMHFFHRRHHGRPGAHERHGGSAHEEK